MIRLPFAIAFSLLVTILLTGCQTPQAGTSGGGSAVAPSPTPTLAVSQLRSEPIVRIRIARQTPRATFGQVGGSQPLHIAGQSLTPPVEILRQNGRFMVRSTAPGATHGNNWLAFDTAQITLATSASSAGNDPRLTFNNAPFPGQFTLVANGPASFDIINALPIEAYLPGVLERELYPKWHRQAYEAQAIAARSYAIAHLPLSRDKAFDLESSVASQAYGGTARNATAIAAVSATRGRVLTWHGQVIPAYYSSNAGGVGQDAVVAIKGGPDIPPLRGTTHGGWAAASPRFTWGPIVRDRADLARRLAAWGRANKHPVAGLQSIADLAITQRNSVGRPTRFTVTDATGQRYDLGPEQFRFAANFAAPAPGKSTVPLPEALTLYSSFVELRSDAQRIIITGRGHGHGVGLDQWAAQGMATQGHNHAAILAFFYPGATITQAY